MAIPAAVVETLLRFKQMYRDSGMLTVLNGELPDLPLVLGSVRWWDRRKGPFRFAGVPSVPSFFVCPRRMNLPHYGLLPEHLQDATFLAFSADSGGGQKMAGYGPPVETVGPRMATLIIYTSEASARSQLVCILDETTCTYLLLRTQDMLPGCSRSGYC